MTKSNAAETRKVQIWNEGPKSSEIKPETEPSKIVDKAPRRKQDGGQGKTTTTSLDGTKPAKKRSKSKKRPKHAKHFVTNPKHPQGRRRVIKRAL
jgi:hypothetical protein